MRAAVVMKQLTRVVGRQHDLGGVGAGGQQHLGQHGGTDPPQVSHGQLADITEPEVGQDLLCRGTLRGAHRDIVRLLKKKI